jgi:hypothetical protein
MTRLKIVLGKFLCTKVQNSLGQIKFAIDFPGLGYVVVPVPLNADIREGDLLTLYTEVLTKERSDA